MNKAGKDNRRTLISKPIHLIEFRLLSVLFRSCAALACAQSCYRRYLLRAQRCRLIRNFFSVILSVDFVRSVRKCALFYKLFVTFGYFQCDWILSPTTAWPAGYEFGTKNSETRTNVCGEEGKETEEIRRARLFLKNKKRFSAYQ